MKSALASFTSAGQFPLKLLALVPSLRRRIYPHHLQLNLTNQCQLSCPYCSCAARERSQVQNTVKLARDIASLKARGLRSVTITGGGEPLLHPQFAEIIALLRGHGLKIGLVTNGIAITQWHPNVFRSLEWIRISYDASRNSLPSVWSDLPDVAWSYVYTKGAEKTKELKELIARARRGEVTHLRIVSDIRSAQGIPPDLFPDRPPNVIIQDRSTSHTRGAKQCWISLLKPVLDTDGLVYPCCGAQYAIKGNAARFPERLCMGTISDYVNQFVFPQRPFDGSICDVCYYNEYNKLLSYIKLLESGEITHKEFI